MILRMPFQPPFNPHNCLICFRAISRRPDSRRGDRVPEHPCDARQRVELVAFRRARQQQQEYKVNGILVDRRKVDRLLQPDQNSKGLVELRDSRVRDRYALAHAGRAQLLALEDFGGDEARRPLLAPLRPAATALSAAVLCPWHAYRR